jgi:hypothetical protein
MKTKHEHFIGRPHSLHSNQHPNQRGNALIYVLVAIVLLAALSMTLGRQTDTSESSDLDDAKAEMYATQLMAYAAATKNSIDQMLFSNDKALAQLDFTLPTQAGFNTAPTIYKVYHPDGGGLNAARLPADITTSAISDPVAGWYLGRFNNVEWTPTTATVIDNSIYTGATNVDLTTDPAGTPLCSACHKRASLCVEDASAGTYGFYTIIADR